MDDDRVHRWILAVIFGAAAISAAMVIAALGITAWVIIRVTLHFT